VTDLILPEAPKPREFTPEEKRNWKSKVWRLNNIYRIVNESGQDVLFSRIGRSRLCSRKCGTSTSSS
jgi:hypothetical protein